MDITKMAQVIALCAWLLAHLIFHHHHPPSPRITILYGIVFLSFPNESDLVLLVDMVRTMCSVCVLSPNLRKAQCFAFVMSCYLG